MGAFYTFISVSSNYHSHLVLCVCDYSLVCLDKGVGPVLRTAHLGSKEVGSMMIPIGNKILVVPIPQSKLVGKIHLPAGVATLVERGTVVAVGKPVVDTEDIQVEDTLIYFKDMAVTFEREGVSMVNLKHVLAVEREAVTTS